MSELQATLMICMLLGIGLGIISLGLSLHRIANVLEKKEE